MQQFRAHGPLTRTILLIAALDDIFGIIAFGIHQSCFILKSPEPMTVVKMI